MTKIFFRDLEEKRIIPKGLYPYMELVEENPSLDNGVNLTDFYQLSPFASDFFRKATKHTTITHQEHTLETSEQFGKLYTDARKQLAEKIKDQKFRGGLTPLELFLVFEYYHLQHKGQPSGNLTIKSRAPKYPHIDFLWECGLADYANQINNPYKEQILGNEKEFYLDAQTLATITLAEEHHPLPLKNSLTFNHTHLREGTIKEDDATFTKIGIPQTYLNHLRQTYEQPPLQWAIWNGNAQLFNKISSLTDRFHYNSKRFKDFLQQFQRYQRE